ncbi:DUF881 domain-containing protein [Spirilliplanes yamanashiensis]|uniref:DUF881 domain-containing protein n=1 Tax=Spirilliplanes yamanashiensis TaxID=42233 RepID=UPI003522A43B
MEPPDQPAPPAADPAADPATGPATGWPAATAPDPAAPATPDPAPQLEPPTGDPAGDPVGTGAGVVHGPGPYPASVTESAAVASGAAEPVPPAVGERTVQLDPGVVAAATADAPAQEPPAAAGKGFWSSGTVLIGLLLALFGFMFVVQLRSSSTDEGLGAARQEDLVRILSDLNAREQRLSEDIRALEETRSRLASGVEGRQEALAQAEKRAQELGLLAGTVPARGPGLLVTISSGSDKPAAKLLNAVQELRGAGGEVMQLTGANGVVVRVVASTAFVDTADGILAGGQKVTGPYELRVIGDPEVMDTALNIPGGVVADVSRDGGTVNTVKRDVVDVTATREPTALRYARPVN